MGGRVRLSVTRRTDGPRVPTVSAPLVLADPDMTLEAASRLMVEKKVSALVALDGAERPAGIVTERDVLRALARDGAGAAAERVAAFLSSPVHEIRADAFVYKALGRMMRHAVRHLVAVAPATRKAVGMVTGRALLKLRSGEIRGSATERAKEVDLTDRLVDLVLHRYCGLSSDEIEQIDKSAN